MSVIVLAVLALLILVVLAFIFMSRMGVFSTGVSECKSQGGMCAEQCGEGSAVNNPTEYGPASGACEKINVDKPLCCIPITG